MKNIFDFVCAFIGLVILTPLLIIISIIIKIGSKGPILFKQERVGLKGQHFKILKFRSMFIDRPTLSSLITIGDRDPRVTKVGFFIRKFKIDELPQLINVLKGEMSLVGPRPEVAKYVNLYTAEQRMVLEMKPGITDMASIKYRNESEILALQQDPELYYAQIIMPDKININLKYANYTKTVFGSIRVIFETLKSI
ncbi:putative sugar transferase EpsL [Pedobacter glucosidilyticus]|nr:sugar transferase [Pedobacter glucosidilyticus]KHJ39136.1 putative sugar transferase EpsL [Pedobacter glucosidilyticus]